MAGKSSVSRMAMKAMGIFGGVQVVGILCSIVRVKLVAMWLGPTGVGLFNLYNRALEMVHTATNLSIRQSSVPDISQAAEDEDKTRLQRMITGVRRWTHWLALAGVIILCALAPLLSQLTFGDGDHIWGFVALSAALLFNTVTNGELAVMQGLQKMKRLANATMWGTVFGLVVSIPLFYFLRQDSVIPSIIAYAAGCLIFAYLFRDRDYPAVKMSVSETAVMGKGFVKLGVYMTIGTFVSILMDYVFNAWLNVHVDTKEVGFYGAGYTLFNKYTGLVLTALGMEYFPRLSSVAHSAKRLTVYVVKEINVAMMVMAAIVPLFLLLRSEVVNLLYSEEFQVILTFVSWGLLGTVFRTFSWCLAFVILAKGDGRTFVVTETISDVIGLGLNIGCYLLWGLNGLGIAFMAWYIIYSVMMLVVYVMRYHLKLGWGALLSTGGTLAASAVVMWSMENQQLWLGVVITAISLIVSGIFAKRQWFG